MYMNILFYLFLGEIDVDNMYVGEESECSADVETVSDDKYATAVESIDIPRKGSYLFIKTSEIFQSLNTIHIQKSHNMNHKSEQGTTSTGSVPSMTVEISSGVGEIDTVEINHANSTAIESA